MSTIHWRRILQPKTLFAWDNVSTRASSTSWLDGLRGVAALQVFFFHFFGRHINWGHTYGASPEDYYLHQLPIFRSIWGAGSGAVATFFVISGYAITDKSFSLLRQKNFEALYNGLCSSLFRRGFRLFLPVIILAVPCIFLMRIVDMTDAFVYGDELRPTVWNQIGHFINTTDHHINPFDYKDGMVANRYVYVPTSWTIPLEYYGSIVCYVMVMVVSRMGIYRTRSIVIGGMCFYALHRGSWWTSNFLFGMWMADHTLEQSSGTVEKRPDRQRLLLIVYSLVFAFGVYLAGMPPESLAFDFAPVPKIGYMWLYKLYPPNALFILPEEARWYWYWSGNLTFLGVSKIPRLQTILNGKFCQWLGKLSFSLYLVHAAVISIFSRTVQGYIKIFTENAGAICLLEAAVLFPLIVIVSGVAERFVDQPSVRFAKWLEGQVFQQEDRGHPLETLQHPLMGNGIASRNPTV